MLLVDLTKSPICNIEPLPLVSKITGIECLAASISTLVAFSEVIASIHPSERGCNFKPLSPNTSLMYLTSLTAFSPSRASALQLKLKHLNSENDILGDISGLQEGLSATAFRMEFGNTSSEEYTRIVREIHRRLVSCSVYR